MLNYRSRYHNWRNKKLNIKTGVDSIILIKKNRNDYLPFRNNKVRSYSNKNINLRIFGNSAIHSDCLKKEMIVHAKQMMEKNIFLLIWDGG